MTTEDNTLLKVNNLQKYFHVSGGIIERILGKEVKKVHAVDGIDLEIKKGEIFGLVGESGCGKTTTARLLNGLEDPSGGEFYWKGDEIEYDEIKPKKDDIKTQFVFQDPYSSLNPRMKIGDLVQHPLIIQDRIDNEEMKKGLTRATWASIYAVIAFILFLASYVGTFIVQNYIFEDILILLGGFFVLTGSTIYYYFGYIQKNKLRDEQVLDILRKVGLNPPLQYYDKYPHELSGGERQRVNIARSIILNPDLLILDEPTSMLDVSLRAGILDLLENIKEEFDISILFITHDLATARHFCDRVSVMYVGEIVETGDTNELFEKPIHPYTKSLVDAIPSPTSEQREKVIPKGDVADSINPPSACRFHPRCPFAEEKCSTITPKLEEKKKNRLVSCHFPLIDN